ncbi:MAG: hypothetical protein GX750_00930 [Clostridia bacterium]|nr:hypothetical protein [Clostridia bacterium]
MSKGKGKTRTKKTKSKTSSPASVVRVSGRLANLLDHVKQALYHEGLTYEELYRRMQEKLPAWEPEKLERDLKRCLGNNISFNFKKEMWQMDKSGNPGNDPFYQYLMTMGYPVTFRELLSLAQENGLGSTVVREQDFAYDGRFIRLKNGKWALTYWQVVWEVGTQELNQAARLIQKRQGPVSINYLAQELLGLGVSETNLAHALSKDTRFLEVAPGQWYLKSLLDALIADLSAPDEFAFIRQVEINALQEAELMLIIEEADASRREYILSSWDLEKGVLRLSKRMIEIFEPIDRVAYLKVATGNGELGVWFLKEQKYLAGLGPWFEEYGLEPGSKVEVSPSQEPGYIELKPSREREAEVFAEGLRVKKLVKLKKECSVTPRPLEEVCTEILQLYPKGLDLDTLGTLVGLIAGTHREELLDLLEHHPYFEQDKQGTWYCNLTMRQAYLDWQKERQEILASLESYRQQVAVTTEEFNTLYEIKTSLEEELAYLQDHHRHEEALFQAKIEELSATNEHLTLENNRLKNEYALLEQKQQELLEHVEHQGSQLVTLRTEKNKLKVKLEQTENRAMQLQSTLNQLMEDAQREVDRLKKEVVSKTHQLESLQYANKELQRNLARLHEERRQMKRQATSWPVRILMFFSGLMDRRKTIGG